MDRILRSLLAAAVVCMLVLACGTGTDDDRAGSDAAEADHGAAEPQAPAQEGQQEPADQTGSDVAGEDSAQTERDVITTADASVEVDDPEEAVEDLLSRTAAYGGHVEDRRQSTDANGNPQHASLTLRVPAENLPDLLEELSEIGEVSEVSETSRDVTGTVRDLDARIEALQTSVDRLLEILSDSENAEELLQVETTLSERQADLEALQAQRNDLSDQVAMSTLQLQLSTDVNTEVEPDGFLGGLQSGWNSLVSAANVLLVAAGGLLPWLLVLAVPGAAVILLLRRRARRRGRKTAAGGEAGDAQQQTEAPDQPDSGPEDQV